MQKILGLFLLFMGFVGSGYATQLTGTLKNPDQSGFTGTLYLSISKQSSVSTGNSSAGVACSGPMLVVPTNSIAIPVNNGTATWPVVYGSDCMLPTPVPYNALLKDTNGNTLFSTQWIIEGTTQDVGTIYTIPPAVSPSSLVIGPQGPPGCMVGIDCQTVVSTTPTTSQTITQPINTNLNFITSGTGTLTLNGIQVLTPTSANPIPTSIGGSGSSLGAISLLKSLGTIYSATSWSSLSAFTANGTTPAISGGTLVFSGGGNNLSQSLDYNWYTELPQWSISETHTVGTITSTSCGIGPGLRSYDGNHYIAASLGTCTGPQLGQAIIYSDSGSSVTSGSSTLSVASGDTVQIVLTKNFDTFTATVSDVTKGTEVSVVYQYSFIYPASNITPNTGKFALFNYGGTQTLTALSITSATPVGADVAFVGDSKTAGFYAGSYANAWPTLLQQNFRSVNLGGPGDMTVDVLNRVPEIIALKPKVVVLNIGRNDLGFGSLATAETNYTSIVSQLQAVGIPVYHLLPIYETVLNQTSLSTWITATYPSSALIDSGCEAYSATPTTVLAGDGIHPNQFCSTLIAKAVGLVLQSNSSVTYQTYQSYKNSSVNPIQQVLGQEVLTGSGVVPNPFLGLAYAFSTGIPQTTTAATSGGILIESSDAVNPFGLVSGIIGSGTPGSRTATLQTGQLGSTNSGTLALNPNGGSVTTPTPVLSDRSVNAATTAYVRGQYTTQRTTLCSTDTGVGSGCTITVIWANPFVDTNYTASCQIDGSNAWVAWNIVSGSKTTSAMQIVLYNLTTTTTSSGVLDCIAIHD